MSGPGPIRAWRPAVPGVAEVFHARFTDHAYPMHAHADWTLLIIDSGVVGYDLDRHAHLALAYAHTSFFTSRPAEALADELVRTAPPGMPGDLAPRRVTRT